MIQSLSILEQKLAVHLRSVLGLEVTLGSWARSDRVPLHMRGRYRFASGRLGSWPVVFVLDESNVETAPGILGKHLEQVHRLDEPRVVYVRTAISAPHRRRLIAARVPFVVPGQQVYLPDLGIDLRESFPQQQDQRMVFRPATQAVLVWGLLQRADGMTGGRALARCLLYSPMTLSRAMDEICAAGLAVDASSGRERTIRWAGPRKEVWERARDHLADPVHSRHLIRTHVITTPGLAAGLTALSQQTMIDGPTVLVHALGQEAWIALQRTGTIEIVPHREPGTIEVEVWSYDPMLTAVGGPQGQVDPLSLSLSLRSSTDERVEAALAQLMEAVAW